MADITAGETGLEPAHALLRGAVGEGVRHHLAARLLLQAVIADGVGGVQRFFDIPRLPPVVPALAMEGPYARQAVGLQFLADQQASGTFHPLAALAGGIDLGRNAEQGQPLAAAHTAALAPCIHHVVAASSAFPAHLFIPVRVSLVEYCSGLAASVARGLAQHLILSLLVQAYHLVGLAPTAVFHARRAGRHARYGCAEQVRALAQFEDVRGGYMSLDKLAVDHPGMTGGQARRYAKALFERTHVAFDMVVDLEAVVFQVADPGLAAAAVGVAVHVDAEHLGSLGQAGEATEKQGGKTHGKDPLESGFEHSALAGCAVTAGCRCG